MMEKRVLAAAALSVAFLGLYTKFVLEPQARRAPRQIAQVPGDQSKPSAAIYQQETSLHPIVEEDVITITSGGISLVIGKQSAAVHEALIHLPSDTVKVSSKFPIFSVQLPKQQLAWRLDTQTHEAATFIASSDSGAKYNLTYETTNGLYTADVTLNALSGEAQKALITTTWTQADALSGRQNPLEMVVSGPKDGGIWYQRFHPDHKSGKNVPRGTLLVSLTERYFTQALRHVSGLAQAQLLGSPQGIIAAESTVDLGYKGTLYFGPRDYFYLKQAGFADVFKVGALGQIGLILVMVLKWIAGITHNYGVAILILSALISSMMAPFTLISMRSMKKMQSLKPEMDRIMAKHKGNTQKGNQEVMELYKKHKVSPLSGCLPMFMQIPIFIALLQAITHFIGFRGAHFLWIKDLSLPDKAFALPVALPLLGSYLNILPLVMAGLMYFQTKLSQQNMSAPGPNQPPNFMAGPVMPIMFGVMFYQFPSALVLYWLTNSAISIGTYRLVR